MPFIAAGYPDLATTVATLRALDAIGPAAIEIGFPFSDPIADGPTNQAAYTAALARKVKVADIFQSVQAASVDLSAPLVAMVTFSIVFRYGPERFFAEARRAGFSGLILPDLPPPEARQTCAQIRAAGLDTILLIAPTTAPERRKEISDLCSGFIYYMSLSGITGARDELPPDVIQNVRELKKLTDRPVCVGFGISKRRHVESLAGIADGAIVGSAIVKCMEQAAAEGAGRIATAVADYCKTLILP